MENKSYFIDIVGRCGFGSLLYHYLYDKEFKTTFFKNKNVDLIHLLGWSLDQHKKYSSEKKSLILLNDLSKWHLGLGFKDKAKKIYKENVEIYKEKSWDESSKWIAAREALIAIEEIEKSPKIKIDINTRIKKLSNPNLLIPSYRTGEILSKIEKVVYDTTQTITLGKFNTDPSFMLYLGNYNRKYDLGYIGAFLPNEQTGWFDTPEEFKSGEIGKMGYLNEPKNLRERALRWCEKFYQYGISPSKLTIERLKINNAFLDYLTKKVEKL